MYQYLLIDQLICLQWGSPIKPEFIYKNSIFILTCLNLSLSIYSTFDRIHLLRLFPMLKTVSELVDFNAF